MSQAVWTGRPWIDEDWPVVSRRAGLWLIALAIGGAACLVLCVAAIVLAPSGHNSHASSYAGRVRATHGYTRIDDYGGGDGSCLCNLEQWYIGPVGIDPAIVFTGPALTLMPNDHPYDDANWETLLMGRGSTDRSGECDISVDRLKRHSGLYDYPDLWHLSHRQIAEWNAGRLDVLQFYVGCELDGAD